MKNKILKINNFFDKLKNKKINNILKIFIFALLLYFIFKGIALLVLLIGLSIGLSFIINNLQIRIIGLELVTFIAVLTGLKYGPQIAFIITFILITYHLVAGGFLGTYILWVIPAYCLAAIISGLLPYFDIVRLGIYATLAINLNNIFFTAIANASYLPRYSIYALTNVLFNIFLFSLFGKLFLLFI